MIKFSHYWLSDNLFIILNWPEYAFKWGLQLIWFDLNIFLLQHKAIGIGHKFNNLDRPLPYTNTLYIEILSSVVI